MPDDRIELECGRCGKKLAVPAALAGKRGKCPACAQAIEVPAAPAVAEDAAGPAAPEGLACPKCGAPIAADETFCPACGHKLKDTADDRRRRQDRFKAAAAKQEQQKKVGSGRGAILAAAIVIAIGIPIDYFRASSQLDQAAIDVAMARHSPFADQEKVAEAERLIATARSQLNLGVAIAAGIAVAFVGLWFWAKTKPLPAILTAFLLFLTVVGIGAAFAPETLVKGIIVKVLILAFLGKGLQAAYEYKKLKESGI